MEKNSSNSLYGRNRYETDTIDRYETYREDDVPMSMEERSLVRKIDFFLMPIVCTISFLQVHTFYYKSKYHPTTIYLSAVI